MKKKYSLAIGTVVFITWMIWGNVSIAETHFTISDENIPEAFDGFKIAHLSDIHDRDLREVLDQHSDMVSADAIIITGDLVDSNHADIEQATLLVEDLMEMAPVYYVTGNHEAWIDNYDELEENLLELGVHILNNEAIEVEKDGEMISLIGVEDPDFVSKEHLAYEQAGIIRQTIQDLTTDSDAYRILLSHRPELFDAYVRSGVDLVFSGHAHGGQFRIPFVGGLVAPGQGFFPMYTSGIYEDFDTTMIVSRGLGNSIIPIRFNNRAELIFIELASE